MTDNSQAGDDNPGVIVMPPILFLGALGLSYIFDWLWPVALLSTFLQLLGGAVLIVPGLVFMTNALRGFSAAGTNAPPNKPATALVTSGIYGFSRNPIYLGMIFLYLGLGTMGDNLYAVFLLAPVLLILRYGVIGREETYLEGKFGQDYLDYKAAVKRWF